MSGAVSPVLTGSPVGPRRRPSGEPPPLPRRIDATTRWYLLAVGLTFALWAGLSYGPVLREITRFDLAVLRLVADIRTPFLTSVMRGVAAGFGSPWTVRLAGVATIAVLVAVRRFRHLAAYLAVGISAALLAAAAVLSVGRMRPAGVEVLGRWEGYADPSRPVALLGLVAVGALYTLVPAGRWRSRFRWPALAAVVVLGVARLYLAVDHPSDVLAGLGVGWALPVVGFRIVVPDDVFPVVYRPGRRAHLDVGGARGEAIVRALRHQLGLDVARIEPFGLEGSAGSTPLRLHLRSVNGETAPVLFAKLYALNHLRSDRWYKLARMILYGRLEDEKPFSTVRRLVEYEDHMLRLLRDAGLPVPQPYGFAEITPEREYVIVMEYFPEAVEIGRADVDAAVAREALAVVRQLWNAGVAHRDIKPSNVLVQDGRVVLIDVAFAAVRPTPWRQAVDLANMMLTVGLRSTPDAVYGVALEQFAAEDIAEAFAASRSITVPTQLRERVRADGRDLAGCFRRLAPARPAVPIQLWSIRRVALLLGVVVAASLAVAVLTAYLEIGGLL